jgi:hypothetical protein
VAANTGAARQAAIAIDLNGSTVYTLQINQATAGPQCALSSITSSSGASDYSFSFPPSGGSGSFYINFSAASGCTWSVSPPAIITISGPTSGSNTTMSVTIPFTIAAFSGGSQGGFITFTVNGAAAGSPISIVQDGSACTASYSPASVNIPASGGSGSVILTVGSNCAWFAPGGSSAPWATLTYQNANNFSYAVSANTGAARSATVTAAPNLATFTINQVGLTVTSPSSLSNGTVGVAYTPVTYTASGGTGAGYTWSCTGLPSGLNMNNGGVLSGTPAAGSQGSYTAVCTVRDSGNNTAQSSLALTIIPPAFTVTSTSLPNGTVGVAYGQTLAASGGAPPYSNWTVVSGALPGGLTLTAASGAISGTPTASGAFPFSVTVKDSAGNTSPAQSLSITITVQPVQGLTVTQNGGASAPNQTNLLVSFGQAAQSTYTGTLSASFQPDPSVTNVPANYIDPAGGFPVSAQSTALTQNFTMSPGATQSSIQFGLGTVAGTWTVILTSLSTGGEPALPTSPPSCTVPVAAAAPSITAGSVQIVNLTSSGFSVQLTGFATTRDVSSAAFVFTAAAGAQLQGTTVTVPFNGQDQSQWFDTTASLSAGGTFSLLLPFGYSGDPSALGSVAATLTNSRGQTSASVTGAP